MRRTALKAQTAKRTLEGGTARTIGATRVRARAAAFAILVALAGCGSSPPTRYFSLEAIAPGASATGAPALMAPVQLGSVRVPASLDRPEIVAQDAQYRLSVRDGDRWGAPFATMLRSTLAQDLLARLPRGSFVLPGAPAPAGTRGLVVTVLDLRAKANGQLTFEGSWTLTSGEPATADMTREVSLMEPMSSNDSTAIADAMSRLLAHLADDIAASLAAGQ